MVLLVGEGATNSLQLLQLDKRSRVPLPKYAPRLATTIKSIQANRTRPGFPAELHAGSSQSARTVCFSAVNLRIGTSMRVSPIILNGPMSQCSAILAFRTIGLMSNLFSRVLIAKSDPQNTASLG